jgi:lysozyme family protein
MLKELITARFASITKLITAKVPLKFIAQLLLIAPICLGFYMLGYKNALVQQTPSSSSRFNIAVEYVLQNEGGLSNNPNDRGGLTKFGISKASYPNIDIQNLTRDDAIKIYKKDMWDRFKLERIKDQDILNKVFDMIVLMGKARATLLFESTLIKLGFSIPKDGILDDEMVHIINNYNSGTLLAKYREELKRFIDRIVETNPTQKVFYRGWLNRINQ